MKRSAAAALTMTVLLTACGLLPAGGGVPGDPGGAAGAPVPAGPDGELRPDLLEVDPDQAAPGDIVALKFPEQTTRGVLFALDQRVDDAWVRQFFLVSDGPGPGWERDWWLAGEEGPAIPGHRCRRTGAGPRGHPRRRSARRLPHLHRQCGCGLLRADPDCCPVIAGAALK